MSRNLPGTSGYSMRDADRTRPRGAISLPRDLWAEIDAAAEERDVSRSALMEIAAREFLAGEGHIEAAPAERWEDLRPSVHANLARAGRDRWSILAQAAECGEDVVVKRLARLVRGVGPKMASRIVAAAMAPDKSTKP